MTKQAISAEHLELRREDIRSAAALELISALNAELRGRYPEPDDDHFRLDPAEVSQGRGAFLVGFLDGKPVACGAVRRLDADQAELKRMYVLPALRGRGLATNLLTALEREASTLGAKTLLLETGTRQPEAIALYERAGFSRIPPFGEYLGSELSVCMAKTLTVPPGTKT